MAKLVIAFILLSRGRLQQGVSSASKKNGRDTIVPIRTPIARPPHYTTVSEVATMDFLRTVLKLPVPTALAYSTSSVNPIGVECILMERVEGENPSSRRLSLTTSELKKSS